MGEAVGLHKMDHVTAVRPLEAIRQTLIAMLPRPEPIRNPGTTALGVMGFCRPGESVVDIRARIISRSGPPTTW